MTNQFDSKGGGQNVGIGKGAIGQQENTTQEVRGDCNIFSATGDVIVHQGLWVKPRTMVLASVLAATVLGAIFVGWHWLAPAGKSASTIGNNSPAINTVSGNVAVTYNVSNSTVADDDIGATKPCKDIGGVDLNEYCIRRYGVHAVLEGKGAYDWRCASKILTASGSEALHDKHELSVNEACTMLYGEKTHAEAGDPKNPYSWRCIQCK